MKRSSAVLFLTLFCLLAGLVADAFAAPTRPRKRSPRPTTDGYLSFGAGYLSGNTTYRIDIYDQSSGGEILSELMFPLNTLLLGLEAGYITKDARTRDAWKFSLACSIDAGTVSGKLEDSDWMNDVVDTTLVGATNPGKDIYSESSVDLNARMLDLRISRSCWLSDSLAVGPLAGYLYQSFEFTARDVNQVGYGPYASSYSGVFSGKVLNYEVTYQIPYAGIHSEVPAGTRFRMTFDLGYSPWAKAEDEDDHVLRTKKAQAKASGSAWLAALAAQWELKDNNFIIIRGEYRKIETTGSQTQYWYGNTSGEPPAGTSITGVSDRITSEQISLVLLATSRF